MSENKPLVTYEEDYYRWELNYCPLGRYIIRQNKRSESMHGIFVKDMILPAEFVRRIVDEINSRNAEERVKERP